MKCKLLLSATILAVLILFSCNRSGETTATDNNSLTNQPTKPPQPAANKEKIPEGPIAQTTADSIASPLPVHIDWDKKIIKTATIKVEVKDFRGYANGVYKTVKQYGGYIAQEEQHATAEKWENTITIKVPVSQFEDMLNNMPAADAKLIERNISSDEVSGELIDVQSRLEAKKQVRLKYLDFLKTSKNMEEALQVQSEINTLQETIESAAGRIASLNHQSAMSTIQLNFFQPLTAVKPINDNPSFLSRLKNAFTTGGRWVADLVIAILAVWPFILLLTGGYFIARKLFPTKKEVA